MKHAVYQLQIQKCQSKTVSKPDPTKDQHWFLSIAIKTAQTDI